VGYFQYRNSRRDAGATVEDSWIPNGTHCLSHPGASQSETIPVVSHFEKKARQACDWYGESRSFASLRMTILCDMSQTSPNHETATHRAAGKRRSSQPVVTLITAPWAGAEQHQAFTAYSNTLGSSYSGGVSMSTEFCTHCKQSHPGRSCDYNDRGECAETLPQPEAPSAKSAPSEQDSVHPLPATDRS
jgi:hypothetical protein